MQLAVGITGASGAMLGVRALQLTREMPDVETHLVITRAGRDSIHLETDLSVRDVEALADHTHADNDLASPLASGTSAPDAMIVAPCSITSLSAIATCYDANLLVRAADVLLKERRRVVLMVREAPLHAGHLRLMQTVTESGAIVMPPVPAFYLRPGSVDELVTHSTAHALALVGVPVPGAAAWTGRPGPDSARGSR